MSDLISILALFVSGIAIWQTHNQSSKSDRLTEQEVELLRHQLASNRLAAIQEKQSNISARMFKEGKNWRVRVFNTGPSEARNVRLLLDENNHLVSESSIRGKFPMDRMEKGQSVDFWANVHMSSPLKETLTIQWDDLSAADRKYSVEITV